MKKLLISGSNDSMTIKGKSITNLHLEVVYQYTTSDEGTTTNINLSSINLQSELSQGGKKESFQVYALPSHLRYLSKTHYASGMILDASPLANTQFLGHLIGYDCTNSTRSIIVPIINGDLALSEDDHITINVQQLSGLSGANVDSTQIYICYDEQTDVEQPFLRIPRFIPLNTSVSEVTKSVSLMDDFFITAYRSRYNDVPVCSALTLNSKFLNIQSDFNDFLKSKNQKIVTESFVLPVVDLQGNSYLKNVDFKLNVNVSNVTSNVDFVVYDEIIPNFRVFSKFADKLKRYSETKQSDLLEVSTDCKC